MRPPTATRCYWSRRNAINATLYDKLNFNFIRDIAPVAGICARLFHGGASVVSGQDGSRVIAYAKANPGKINMARPATAPRHIVGRAVQDDGRRRHGACALSRRRARAHRSDRRTGAGHVRPRPVRRSSISGPASCARSRLPPRRARPRCRTCRPLANSCRDTRRALGWHRRTKGHAAPKSSTSSTRRSMRASPIPRSRHGLPNWAARRLPSRPPTSASSSPRKPRSGAR